MGLLIDTRVGAYGLIIEDGRVLLAHYYLDGHDHWTLPGGGLEPGEDVPQAAIREVMEETGYEVELAEVLGFHSHHFPPERRIDRGDRYLHSLQIVYRARIVGGELRNESDGSTDEARWFDLAEVPGLLRVPLVNFALERAGLENGLA